MIDYSNLSDIEAERVIYGSVAGYVSALALHGEVGIMCRDVERRQLWKHRPCLDGTMCRSFGQWMSLIAPDLGSRSRLYQAKRDVEALPDVPDAELAAMRPCNFFPMQQVSTAVRRDPAVLEAAKTEEHNGFVRKVNAEHPDQHLGEKTTYRFSPIGADAEEAAQALKTAAEEHSLTSQTAAFAAICKEYNLNRLFEAMLRDGDTYEGTIN